MTDLQQRILNRVRDRLGAERLATAIVYLDPDLKHSGEQIHVGDVVIDVHWDSVIVFVDLEPKSNWGHACSYLAIRLDGDDMSEYAAHMPPFLKAELYSFCLLWCGPLVPEWAVARDPCS